MINMSVSDKVNTIAVKDFLNNEMKVLDAYLKKSVKSPYWILDKITSYMLKTKGKQMRPMFVFLVHKCFAPINERAYVAACLIELLHTATLIHDDVVDEADYRRNWFSIKGLWKNKIAVLSGDFILSRGMLLALENKEYRMLEIVSKAVKKMSEGELLQLEKSRRLNLDEGLYERIIKEKTASLLAACCANAAISADCPDNIVDKMWDLGENIGMAFQIQDDILDFSSASSGKIKAGDLKEQKLSLPFIHLINNSSAINRRKYINIIKRGNSDDKKLAFLLNQLKSSGSIDYAINRMMAYLQKAKDILIEIPESESKKHLVSLIDYVSQRKH